MGAEFLVRVFFPNLPVFPGLVSTVALLIPVVPSIAEDFDPSLFVVVLRDSRTPELVFPLVGGCAHIRPSGIPFVRDTFPGGEVDARRVRLGVRRGRSGSLGILSSLASDFSRDPSRGCSETARRTVPD